MKTIVALLVSAVFSATSLFADGLDYREWSSKGGEHSVEAALVRESDTSVVLKRKDDGSLIVVKKTELSDEDREAIKAANTPEAKIRKACAAAVESFEQFDNSDDTTARKAAGIRRATDAVLTATDGLPFTFEAEVVDVRKTDLPGSFIGAVFYATDKSVAAQADATYTIDIEASDPLIVLPKKLEVVIGKDAESIEKGATIEVSTVLQRKRSRRTKGIGETTFRVNTKPMEDGRIRSQPLRAVVTGIAIK